MLSCCQGGKPGYLTDTNLKKKKKTVRNLDRTEEEEVDVIESSSGNNQLPMLVTAHQSSGMHSLTSFL